MDSIDYLKLNRGLTVNNPFELYPVLPKKPAQVPPSEPQGDSISVSEEAIEEGKATGDVVKESGDFLKTLRENTSDSSDGVIGTKGNHIFNAGKGISKTSTLIDGLDDLGEKGKDQSQAALKVGEGSTGVASTFLNSADDINKVAGKTSKATDAVSDLTKLGGAGKGLGVLSGTFGLANSIESFQNAKGDEKTSAGLSVVGSAGDLTELVGGAAEAGGKALGTAAQTGKFASSASTVASVGSKIGTVGKVLGPAGAIVSGGIDTVKGGMDIYKGINSLNDAKTSEEKSEARDQIIGGSLDAVSGGLAIAAGVCAASGVGAPVALALGAASLGVKGGKFIYEHREQIGNGLKKVGGAVADGAQKVGGAVADGAQKVGSVVSSGASKVGSVVKGVADFHVDTAKKAASTVTSGAAKVGSAVTDGTKKVASTVASGASKVGSVVTDGAKKVGSTVSSAASTVASGASKVGSTVTDGAKSVGGKLKSIFS